MLDRRLLLTSAATVLVVESFELNLRICAVVMVREKVGEARLVHEIGMEVLTRMQL